MIKIQIKNRASQEITNIAKFQTQAEVDAWISECESVKAFGMPEHQVMVSPAVQEVIDEETGEILQHAQDAVYETIPAEYEILPPEDLTEQLAQESQKQAKIEAGKAARETCQQVLDFIAGTNLDKELTIEQITQMQQTYVNAEAALRAGRPTMAKSMISSIVPDGVLVTEQEKAQCLQILSNY